ncbi:MAG: hypothetical protein HY507_00060 [Candidatus Zambryskibacteria bacterium]|nr:hypothetical protein [Candidatus Zambryskibacteria bacterium]
MSMPVFATNIFFNAENNSFAPNQEFLAQIFLNTEGQSVNAIEGEIIFPSDLLEVRKIRDGNSSVNFWIDPVRNCVSNGVERPDSICFSGITPGGLSGSKELLFSVLFRAKKGGSGTIQTDKLRVLRNNGLGTPVETKISNFQFSIPAAEQNSLLDFVAKQDTELPEKFKPEIAQSTDLFAGKYFLVFSTQDKGSGIDHYEVCEESKTICIIAKSPYVLENQKLDKKIFIKAVDKVGNVRTEIFYPPNFHPWYKNYWILAILIISSVLVFYILKKLWRKYHKQN